MEADSDAAAAAHDAMVAHNSTDFPYGDLYSHRHLADDGKGQNYELPNYGTGVDYGYYDSHSRWHRAQDAVWYMAVGMLVFSFIQVCCSSPRHVP